MLYDRQRVGREFDSRRLHNLLFSSARAGDNTDGYDGVLLDTRSVWRGKGPGDHCFEVDQIPRTQKHIFFVGCIALP